MKITDIFKEKEVTLSFEVFPPKTDAGYEAVEKAAAEIAALKPDFMSLGGPLPHQLANQTRAHLSAINL